MMMMMISSLLFSTAFTDALP